MPHPEPDQNFYFDADPGRERHQNDAGPHADPAPSFTHVGITEIRVFTYIHSSASPLRYIFLVIDTDPDSPYDWHALDADPDPAK
jgi:hypothetical protein